MAQLQRRDYLLANSLLNFIGRITSLAMKRFIDVNTLVGNFRPSRGRSSGTADQRSCSLLDCNSTATGLRDTALTVSTQGWTRQPHNHVYSTL